MKICRDALSIVLDFLPVDDCVKFSFTNRKNYNTVTSIFNSSKKYSRMILTLQLCSKLELFVPNFIIMVGYPQLLYFILSKDLSNEYFQYLISSACSYGFYLQIEIITQSKVLKPTTDDLCKLLRFDSDKKCTLKFFKTLYLEEKHDTTQIMEHAAAMNRIDIIEFLVTEYDIPLDDKIQYRAATWGHDQLLIDIHDMGFANWSYSAIWLAAFGYIGKAKRLEALGAPMDDLCTLIREASLIGCIKGVQFGLSRGAAFNQCLRFALYECHLELCDFLVSEGHPTNEDTYFLCAVESGDPLAIYWCFNNNVPHNPAAMIHACSNGSFPIVNTLLEFDIPISHLAVHAAIANKRFELLRWIFKEIYSNNEFMFKKAAECCAVTGSIKFLDFLYKNGPEEFVKNSDPIVMLAHVHQELTDDAIQLLNKYNFNVQI